MELNNDVFEFVTMPIDNHYSKQTIILIDTSYDFIKTSDYKLMLNALKIYLNSIIKPNHFIQIITLV